MAEDFNALKTALTNDARYDAAVVSGNNGEVTRLLNELEPAQTVIIDVPRRAALKAFKDAVRTLTQLEMDRLKLVMGESEEIATSDPDIRAEIVDIFGGGSAAVTRLTVAATHGSPWYYDTYVPIVFAGMDLPAAVVDRKVYTIDIAPTLSAYISIRAPSGSVGTPLQEVLQKTTQ